MKIIGFIRPHRNETSTHHEAVHLTTDGAVHVSDFVSVKIVATREIYVPVLSWSYVAVETEVVSESACQMTALRVLRALNLDYEWLAFPCKPLNSFATWAFAKPTLTSTISQPSNPHASRVTRHP